MLKLPKPTAIAIQATLGIALSAWWAVSALAAPPDTATQGQTTPRLQEGDLVRLRSGGPEMTVKSVRGQWVIAVWWNEGFGGFQSAGFPAAEELFRRYSWELTSRIRDENVPNAFHFSPGDHLLQTIYTKSH